jgi:hypothetical protein
MVKNNDQKGWLQVVCFPMAFRIFEQMNNSSCFMRLRYCLFFGFMQLLLGANAQVYPLDYFRTPMDTPLYLSAPFASLRDNHFHSGNGYKDV